MVADPGERQVGELFVAVAEVVEGGRVARRLDGAPGGEHDALLDHGWTVTAGKAGRGSGYSRDPRNGRRERLWMSPACRASREQGAFDLDGATS